MRAGKIIAFLTLALSCLAILACHPPKKSEALLPRPQPAYTAWLEKQSMSAQAAKLIAQVSQSDKLWMFSGKGAPPRVLLQSAPQWLELSSTLFPAEAFLKKLARDFPAFLRSGIKGLYLGPLGEDQSWWQSRSGQISSTRPLPASLTLDPRLGDENDLARLAEAAENSGLELGADILAANTSMGPDFFLQARSATGHGGLYAMLELPAQFWPAVSLPKEEWDGVPLSPEQVRNFSKEGILPESLYRDGRNWGPAAGWAATGEVQGTDGNFRRWLYRYEGEANSPVLLWQDPSGLAARVFSGAIIQHTGFWRLPLAGLRLGALMGLEPRSQDSEDQEKLATQSVSPGLEALNVLAGQIHRYGGWALQADSVPSGLIEAILAGACDFCREDATEQLLIQAFKSEDVSGLFNLYSRWLEQELDQSRLARGFNFAERSGKLLDMILPASSQEAEQSEKKASIQRALLAWRLGLPGLAFLSPDELGLYDTANNIQESILISQDKLAHILSLRAQQGLAAGKVIKIFRKDKSSLALLSALPENGCWLVATNFSSSPIRFSLALPQKFQKAQDVESGKDMSQALEREGRELSLPLDAYESRQLFLSN